MIRSGLIARSSRRFIAGSSQGLAQPRVSFPALNKLQQQRRSITRTASAKVQDKIVISDDFGYEKIFQDEHYTSTTQYVKDEELSAKIQRDEENHLTQHHQNERDQDKQQGHQKECDTNKSSGGRTTGAPVQSWSRV